MSRLRRRLASEQVRQTVALVIAIAVSVGVGIVSDIFPFSWAQPVEHWIVNATVWLSVLYATASLSYAILTVIAFTGEVGEDLAALVRATSPTSVEERRRMRWLGIDEFTNAFSYAFVALTIVVTVLFTPALKASVGPTVAALATVIGAWTMILVSFAVRYLRAWAGDADAVTVTEQGEEPIAFSDFIWLAAQLSTSYSAGQIQLRSRELRRAGTAHVILAFAFNSTIVVLLVSVALPALG